MMSSDRSQKVRGLDSNKSSYNRENRLKVVFFKIRRDKLYEISIKMEGKF